MGTRVVIIKNIYYTLKDDYLGVLFGGVKQLFALLSILVKYLPTITVWNHG